MLCDQCIIGSFIFIIAVATINEVLICFDNSKGCLTDSIVDCAFFDRYLVPLFLVYLSAVINKFSERTDKDSNDDGCAKYEADENEYVDGNQSILAVGADLGDLKWVFVVRILH